MERIRELPSREGMRPPRSDLADNLVRFYEALWRHAYARHSARYRLTWGQMFTAAGYDQKPYATPETPIRRYAALLEEAGLVRISGRDELADARTCVVTLLEPPRRLESPPAGRDSSVGEPTTCRAVRRRETRSQRASHRVRPWCRKGGRGRAPEAWSFSWGQYVSNQGLSNPLRGSTSNRQDVRTRGGVGIDTPGAPPGATPAAAPECAPALDLIAALDRGSQLEWLRERLAESGEGRSAALDGLHLAGRAGCDPVAIAIAAWELLFGGRPGLTGKRRGELERACSVLDRLAGRKGAGTDRLLSWMFAVACDLEDQAEGAPVGIAPALGRHPAQPAPATLAYFVTRLRALARARRRAWRQARRGTAAPGSSGGGTDG